MINLVGILLAKQLPVSKNSASHPQQDGKWVPAKAQWRSVAGELPQVQLIPLVG